MFSNVFGNIFIIYLEFVASNFIPLLKWNLICFSSLVFPCGSAGKESVCNVGDLGSIPGLGRYPAEGKGYPLQYSGLENSTDYIVHGVAESDMTERLSLSLNLLFFTV